MAAVVLVVAAMAVTVVMVAVWDPEQEPAWVPVEMVAEWDPEQEPAWGPVEMAAEWDPELEWVLEPEWDSVRVMVSVTETGRDMEKAIQDMAQEQAMVAATEMDLVLEQVVQDMEPEMEWDM